MGKTELIPAKDRRCEREKEAIRSGRGVSAGWVPSLREMPQGISTGQSFLNLVPNKRESNGQTFLQDNVIVQMIKIYSNSSQLP